MTVVLTVKVLIRFTEQSLVFISKTDKVRKLEWIEREDAKTSDGKALFWGVSGAFVPIKDEKTDGGLSLLLVNQYGTYVEKKLGIMVYIG